jgi:hypothetical protein
MRDPLPHFANLRTGGLVRYAQRAPLMPRMIVALAAVAAVAALFSLKL